MTEQEQQLIQYTVDTLRSIRNKFYQYSDAELTSMSLKDQSLYSDNLTKLIQAIAVLDHANYQAIIDEFSRNTSKLQEALERNNEFLDQTNNVVQVVRGINEFLAIVLPIILLLI
ncbi:Uncharacterised protein [Lelliottia amnigena]|uniref:hypothetical protein n=1 Tax=Lelliottia amnigena TaxID=61646 RepID=UPI0007434A2D|nr:hypothetical protein [Lelliottia amnigena]ATG00429.1 hypothetical protein CO697_01960 [Lelliottia amnigena]PEG64399.1 hypothetical protein CRH15_14260 [Lelliottia amnigena]QXA20750.1 hypothetical protein I6L74_15120 [Lelliottia amnigena]VDZ88214.1 Uncharacterised protein [Lelliottia amnigena]